MKIGLIEFTSYHEECLYSQLRFLRDGGHHVELFLNPKLKNQVAPYAAELAGGTQYFDFSSRTFLPKRIGRFIKLFRTLKRGRFDVLIFNTASSNKELMLLCLLFRRGTPALTGTLHNLRKLRQSASQKVFSKALSHYLVLSDYLAGTGQALSPQNTFLSYYAIFFPEYPEVPLEKPAGEMWVCIPGAIEYKRRDYDFVLQVLQAMPQSTNLKIILLGKPEPGDPRALAFADAIAKLPFPKAVKLFHQFVPNAEFHAYLKAADYIWLPLYEHDAAYLKYKISGPMNLAFAYRKPLLCPQSMAVLPDLQEVGLFYQGPESFLALLTRLATETRKEANAFDRPKWTYEYQMRNYNAIVESMAHPSKKTAH